MPFRHLCLVPFPHHRFLLLQLESPAGLYVVGGGAKVDKRNKHVHMSMESGYKCHEFKVQNGKVVGQAFPTVPQYLLPNVFIVSHLVPLVLQTVYHGCTMAATEGLVRFQLQANKFNTPFGSLLPHVGSHARVQAHYIPARVAAEATDPSIRMPAEGPKST